MGRGHSGGGCRFGVCFALLGWAELCCDSVLRPLPKTRASRFGSARFYRLEVELKGGFNILGSLSINYGVYGTQTSPKWDFGRPPPKKKKSPNSVPGSCSAEQGTARARPWRHQKKAILAAKTRPNLVPHGAATPKEATPERGQAQGVSPTPPAALRGDSSSSPLVAAPSSGSGPWVGAGSKLPAGPWLRQHLWHLPDPPVPPWHSWGHPQTLFSSSAPHRNNTRDALPAPPRFFFFETRQGMGGPQTLPIL